LLSVAGFPRDEIDRLEGHVHRRLSGRLRGFRLQVRGSGLILEGRAASYYAKQLAQRAIMEASPLPIAANDIEVSCASLSLTG
jgi:hypothetical protein